MKHLLIIIIFFLNVSVSQANSKYSFNVNLTSKLEFPNTPFSLPVDFSQLLKENQIKGFVSANSIQVIHSQTGQAIPSTFSDSLQTSQIGSIDWVISSPKDKKFEIRFQIVAKQEILPRTSPVPVIGNGDLLRYNTNKPSRLTLPYPRRILDLNNDGKLDFVGSWNYAYKPVDPFSGVVVYPGVDRSTPFNFGNLCRLRFVTDVKKMDLQHFRETYIDTDFVDFNSDNLIDLVTTSTQDQKIHFYLNSGNKDDSGFPYFIKSDTILRQTKNWTPIQVTDYDNDGILDIVINQQLLRNENPTGWPMKLAKPVSLNSGIESCLIDINNDGHLDSICLKETRELNDSQSHTIGYRLNNGKTPPSFGTFTPLPEIKITSPNKITNIQLSDEQGIIVQHNTYQQLTYYKLNPNPRNGNYFHQKNEITSNSSVLALSDQAWPYFCDWDDDGDIDILIGGGYGWPRIVINQGTTKVPEYLPAQKILADGKPIRLLRDRIIGGKHWHNLGYHYPVFTDWDHDGLADLLLPNETNRIFWYKNVGTKKEPQFGKRNQIICEGYPDNKAMRAKTEKIAGDRSYPNSPYPLEKGRPFFWRTGAAFFDFDNDGLMDLATHDGFTRKLTFFKRFKDKKTGELKLRKERLLKLKDGQPIDDRIVNRSAHWTESFHPVDWDRDGLTDIVYSLSGAHNGTLDGGSIYLLRNCGTKENPVFESPRTFKNYGKPIRITAHGPHPWVGDYDGDSYPDVIPCVEWSVYPVYRHAAIEMNESPKYTIGKLKFR